MGKGIEGMAERERGRGKRTSEMGKCEPVLYIIADKGTNSARHQTTAGGVHLIPVFIRLLHEAGGRLSRSVFLKPIREK